MFYCTLGWFYSWNPDGSFNWFVKFLLLPFPNMIRSRAVKGKALRWAIKLTGLSGEAIKLRWVDIDSERRLITLNYPEKGSNPRMWKVSQRLIDMLNTLPKKSEYVFNNKSLKSLKSTFLKSRKRIASKLQNPRLLQISFHTLRHWKATMEYHKTRDILHVKNMLGHKKSKTPKYT